MIKLKDTTKIELWIVTGFISLAFVFTVIQTFYNQYSYQQEIFGNNVWLSLLFSYLVTAICYLLLTLYIEAEFEKQDHEISNAVIFVYLLIDICFLIGIVNAYFFILLSIKIMVIYFTRNKRPGKNQWYHEVTLLSACAMFLHGCAVLLHAQDAVVYYFVFVAPIAIFMYIFSMYVLLPSLVQKKRRFIRYLGVLVSYAILFAAPITLIVLAFLNDRLHGDTIAVIFCGHFITQLIIIPIFTWNIYKARNQKKEEEIYTLKTELGRSDASLNFLKSQINPHFLFNALNTLYGTALQEKAERTGEGIQKLGDMMRFMLQENIEDKIMLSKDVDYLNNYIALQKLRTSTSSEVTIQTQIDEQTDELTIAPMLLIPFVENAFKHGISLKYPSHIKITLQTKDNTLYFDVHNSIHLKADHDPEKLKSGIGLQNVKRRLALLYPNRHELIIRESAREFFIHLTLQLKEND